jgi:hypothetical protein
MRKGWSMQIEKQESGPDVIVKDKATRPCRILSANTKGAERIEMGVPVMREAVSIMRASRSTWDGNRLNWVDGERTATLSTNMTARLGVEVPGSRKIDIAGSLLPEMSPAEGSNASIVARIVEMTDLLNVIEPKSEYEAVARRIGILGSMMKSTLPEGGRLGWVQPPTPWATCGLYALDADDRRMQLTAESTALLDAVLEPTLVIAKGSMKVSFQIEPLRAKPVDDADPMEMLRACGILPEGLRLEYVD